MPKLSPLGQELWDEIQLRYESGQPVLEILKAYGVPESTFHWRRKREGWIRRDTAAALQAVAAAAKNPTPNNVSTAVEMLERRTAEHVQLMGPDGPAAPASQSPEARRTLDLVHGLADRLRRLLKSPQLVAEATPLRDRTKALLDLANALERLQKIERTAMGLDTGQASAAGTVVIVVPGKQSEEEWTRKSLQRNAVDVEEE